MNRNHRPDSTRAAKIVGSLNMKAAKRLISEIEPLAQQSNDPITVHLRSGGGRLDAFYELDDWLNPTDLTAKRPAIIIVAHSASSAAAYLLVVGPFAYATQNARLYFHGVRTNDHLKDKTLKLENALGIALRLDQENRKIAKKMAVKVVFRLAARWRDLRRSGELARNRKGAKIFFGDLANAIGARLSSKRSRKVILGFMDRFQLVFTLACLLPVKKLSDETGDTVALDARLFQAAIAHEFKASRHAEHGIDSTAAAELMVDYLLASELVRGDHWSLVRNLAESFGKDSLGEKESSHYVELKKMAPRKAKTYLTNKIQLYALGLWCFALTLCHQLLLGGHTLTATDAYWLGLVNEVIDEAEDVDETIGLPATN